MSELEQVEAAAMRSAVEASRGGAVAGVRGGICLAQPAVPITELNRVCAVVADLDVDAAISFYRGRDVRYAVCVPPPAAAVEPALAHHGFTRGRGWMKFERGTDAPPEARTDLRVEETSDPDAFNAVAAAGFGIAAGAVPSLPQLAGRPGWHCFLAWAGDEAAACGALFVDGDSGWLGVAATRPALRGRGGQAAVARARIERARELGVSALTTETGERSADGPGPSYRNILRAGFREAYVRPNWFAR